MPFRHAFRLSPCRHEEGRFAFSLLFAAYAAIDIPLQLRLLALVDLLLFSLIAFQL